MEIKINEKIVSDFKEETKKLLLGATIAPPEEKLNPDNNVLYSDIADGIDLSIEPTDNEDGHQKQNQETEEQTMDLSDYVDDEEE